MRLSGWGRTPRSGALPQPDKRIGSGPRDGDLGADGGDKTGDCVQIAAVGRVGVVKRKKVKV